MSKELEALERIKKWFPFNVNELEYADIILVESALKENESLKTDLLGLSQELLVKNKALEIIKEKRVDISWLINVCFCSNLGLQSYNEFNKRKPLTKEEYDLLKEALL